MCKSSFRDFVPNGNHPRLGKVNLEDFDTYSWVDFGLQNPMIRSLWDGWQALYEKPFKGITTNGEPESSLFTLRDEGVMTEIMMDAARNLIEEAEKSHVVNKLRYPVDADEWRCWANPEFYFARHGIRLEEIPSSVTTAALELVKASLSNRGYDDVLAVMRLNGFLGDLVGASRLMNESSYNFILFGEPSFTEPWGWSLWGHHLTFCVLVLGSQIVISPVFRGCEPNYIDQGTYAGTTIFTEEMELATDLMKSLSHNEKRVVVVYDKLEHPDMPDGFPHPADGRNLAGAYEDNKIIPYSGGNVSKMSDESQQLVLNLIKKAIDFLPQGPLAAKMKDVQQHLNRTWFMWMGNYGQNDVFHFRIHSPVLIYEFDHECGMWLTNKEPRRFHVHTVLRTPNGNDYGKELLKLWRAQK